VTNAIHIFNASRLSDRDLEGVAGTTKRVFHVPLTLERRNLDLPRAFDESRGQYRSGNLLTQLLEHCTASEEKWISIVDIDLFIPVLTFIFGEAQLDGRVAIVSTYRLSNEFYGLPDNHQLLLQRLEKEIIHELGHTFGLFHCRQFECVMHSSTYVEEIDLKHAQLCNACTEMLQHARTNETKII
jgi:archaemetzincin